MPANTDGSWLPSRADAELARDVDRADSADGLDAMIGRRCGQAVTARGADAEDPDTLGIRLVASAEERDCRLDVLDPLNGVFEATGAAFALALEGGVERERDESLGGEALGVKAGSLFLHAAAGVADDDRRSWASDLAVRGVKVAGELQAGADEADVSAHRWTPVLRGEWLTHLTLARPGWGDHGEACLCKPVPGTGGRGRGTLDA
jgi:hypothetical protein